MKKLAPSASQAPIALLVILLSVFLSFNGYSQISSPGSQVAKKIALLKQQASFSKDLNVLALSTKTADDLQISGAVKRYALLEVNNIESVLRDKPDYMSFNVPLERTGRQVKLLLYKENISPGGFTLLTEKGKWNPATQDIVHYRGSIDNDPNSVAAFTFSGNEVSGMINNNEGNFVVGKINRSSGEHVVYNDRDLVSQVPFDCATNTVLPFSPVTLARPGEVAAVTTKCVNWYWETDYDLFVNKGSIANVNAYVQSVFNQMATLYANDGIAMVLKTLFVWSAEDPYTGTSTSGYLNQFGAYRTSFDGDLAHLIGLKGGGGIAWINGACKSNKYRMAYSGISSSYSVVPTFSWTVECITHEQGHLLGSPHTHDCSWNGNNTKIDGCGDAAGYSSGSCAVPALPAGGGTIMSYCHLTNAGINFNLGFGPQPTTLMINTINAASCLVACNTCVVPAQPGAITGNSAVCAGSSQTYSVAAVSGATSYTWSLPSGWTGTSTTNSISTTAGAAGGVVSVIAVNSCGNSAARTLSITAAALPAQPAAITGNTAVCAGTSQTYSVAAVAGATSYTWTLPAGWTGTSTTNSITATSGAAGGSISVKANNSCGSGPVATTALTITASVPTQPSGISGNTTVCSGATQVYSVIAVAGVTSYTWTLPTGWTGTSVTNSITVTAGTAAGLITVKANNGCGSGISRSLALTATPLPAAPGAITVSGGAATVCTGDTRTYSVPLVSGVTYNWIAPAGATIVSGQGTSSIQLSFTSGFVSGSSLTVKAVGTCGSSASTGIAISKSSITSPGTISVSGGSSRVCPGDIRTYTVAAVAGITYNWIAPTGGSITSGQGTNSAGITYTSGFTSQGTLRVTANSNCGSSSASTLTVRRNTLSTPGWISGSSTVCPNALVTYSVAAVTGAVSYLWTIPAGASIQGASTGSSVQVRWGSTGGSITVRAVNTCGNSSSRSKSVAISCAWGLTDVSAGMKAAVYPNPANNTVTVRFTAADNAAYTISITDITGRALLTKKHNAIKGANLYSLDVSRFSKGTYIIILQAKTVKELLRLNVE